MAELSRRWKWTLLDRGRRHAMEFQRACGGSPPRDHLVGRAESWALDSCPSSMACKQSRERTCD